MKVQIFPGDTVTLRKELGPRVRVHGMGGSSIVSEPCTNARYYVINRPIGRHPLTLLSESGMSWLTRVPRHAIRKLLKTSLIRK